MTRLASAATIGIALADVPTAPKPVYVEAYANELTATIVAQKAPFIETPNVTRNSSFMAGYAIGIEDEDG